MIPVSAQLCRVVFSSRLQLLRRSLVSRRCLRRYPRRYPKVSTLPPRPHFHQQLVVVGPRCAAPCWLVSLMGKS